MKTMKSMKLIVVLFKQAFFIDFFEESEMIFIENS
jgi:hypothetical protein